MKTARLTLIILFALLLVVTTAVLWRFPDVVASADESRLLSFDLVDGNFVVKTETDTVIYDGVLSLDSADDVLLAIRNEIGDADYSFTIPAPEVTVTLDSTCSAENVFSTSQNLFSFSASATHAFSNMILLGYTPPDEESDYAWSFAFGESAEVVLGGSARTMSFGQGRSHGEYVVYATALARFTFDGKTAVAEGKSSGLVITIDQAESEPAVQSLDREIKYGQRVGEAFEDVNLLGNPGKWFLDESVIADTNKYPSAGVYDYPVYYQEGSWDGSVFTASADKTPYYTMMKLTVAPYPVQVFIDCVSVVQGGEIPAAFSYKVFFNDAQVSNNSKLLFDDTVADLGLQVFCKTDDGKEVDGKTSGAYVITGSSVNSNYDVQFWGLLADGYAVDLGAILSVLPTTIHFEDESFIYTAFNPDGFDLEDELRITQVGVGATNGGSIIRLLICRGDEEMNVKGLLVRIEKKEGSKASGITLVADGITLNLNFASKGYVESNMLLGAHFTIEEMPEDETYNVVERKFEDKGWILGVAAVAFVLALAIAWFALKRRQKTYFAEPYTRKTAEQALAEQSKSSNMDHKNEVDREDVSDDNTAESQNEVAIIAEGDVQDENAEPQMTEDELHVSLHPGYVPVPSLEEVFGNRNVEQEDNDGKDEKDEDGLDKDEKITFTSKILSASVENKALYNAVKNEIMSYRGIKSRVVQGGDYFRRPGKHVIKVILIGKTLRIALSLNPADYDYNVYHQKDRGNMKKYAETPMFVKVQTPLGVRRASYLIAEVMKKDGIKQNKKYVKHDFIYDLTYPESEE